MELLVEPLFDVEESVPAIVLLVPLRDWSAVEAVLPVLLVPLVEPVALSEPLVEPVVPERSVLELEVLGLVLLLATLELRSVEDVSVAVPLVDDVPLVLEEPVAATEPVAPAVSGCEAELVVAWSCVLVEPLLGEVLEYVEPVLPDELEGLVEAVELDVLSVLSVLSLAAATCLSSLLGSFLVLSSFLGV